VALTVPAAAAAEPDAPTGVLAVAHRGAVEDAPESTLAALDQAVADRADRVSIDVHLTADGVPVVVHDLSLSRTTDVEQVLPGRAPWNVSDVTLADLRRLDAGSWFPGGLYTGSRVLTLDEVLADLSGSPTGITLEVKAPAEHGGVAGIGRAVLAVLRSHPEWSAETAGVPRLVVESFDWGFLDALHAEAAGLPLVLLGSPTVADLDTHPYVRELDVRHPALTPELVAAARARGIRVGTWTPNTDADLRRSLDLGADAVTTDVISLLRSLLTARGSLWTGADRPAPAPTGTVAVDAPATAAPGSRVALRVRVTDVGGSPLRWQRVGLATSTGGAWGTVGGTATDGRGVAAVSLPVGDGVSVRVASGAVTSAVTSIVAVIAPVTLPAGAPAPAVSAPLQAPAAGTGADARVLAVPTTVWRAMAGRTWRTGCPVGRAGLRLLQVSYWGFDGRRHRGELVVASSSAVRLGRVFARLHAQHLPIRSLRRLEELGGWTTAVRGAMRSGTGYGYACQRVPGDPAGHPSHARGRVVSINPWENPTRTAGGGYPTTWWLDRSRAAGYVHRTGGAVVRAFAAEGFAWSGSTGRYADFRDVR
jgi:glycerophosphoryl diester phosphodiesterase